MQCSTSLWALPGGALLGLASALALASLGRVVGISGIAADLLTSTEGRHWRAAFVTGLLGVGVLATLMTDSAIGGSPSSSSTLMLAGLAVGFGTRLGSGCTSGHGICGIGRLSARSLIAVLTFMAAGMVTATAATVIGGGQ